MLPVPMRFSPDETHVLHQSTVHLDVAQARPVHTRADGWPAGMRLACVALRGGADPAGFRQRLAGLPQPSGRPPG